MSLARWAVHPERSRGRRMPQPAAPPRNDHQRDRDRVVHSTAFRRLVYKTQVFVNHEGDLFRTRLTHSLEVAQLARSMARALALNEDLVEAIALAHDLGHTPFGHAGQDALHECMRGFGGFEHNLQSLRVVDRLEARYPGFDGLNLTFETREGVLKHCSRADALVLLAEEPDGPARRFVDRTQPSLEAQLVNLADEVAYVTHDLDDGVRSGLLAFDALDEVPLVRRHRAAAQAAHPGLEGRRWLFETLRRLLSAQVADIVATTRMLIEQHQPFDAEAARRLPPLVRFGEPMRAEVDLLRQFLFQRLYRHPQVVQTTDRAREVVATLFEAYRAAPQEMRPDFAAAPGRERAVADYIAGMTDRFATREVRRLTGRDPFAS